MAARMLHTDLHERLVLDTGAIPWVASSELGVWRRMLDRAGHRVGTGDFDCAL
jgi:hypothetical protein